MKISEQIVELGKRRIVDRSWRELANEAMELAHKAATELDETVEENELLREIVVSNLKCVACEGRLDAGFVTAWSDDSRPADSAICAKCVKENEG